MKTGNRENAVKGAQAHTDLNTFSIVKAVLESGSIYTTNGQIAATKIIAICDAQTIKQLKAYDKLLDNIPD